MNDKTKQMLADLEAATMEALWIPNEVMPEVFWVFSKFRISLNHNPISSPKLIEIVDVQRTKLGLQCQKDIG